MKLRVTCKNQITTILNNPLFEFEQRLNRATSEIYEYPQIAKWNKWQIEAYNSTLLEIRGSIHTYWNNGTNENDFNFKAAKEAINSLCRVFDLDPALAFVTNLEYGVNVYPVYPASEMIEQVICFKNKHPAQPYDKNGNCCFLEFKNGETYIKVYDKGRQLKTDNILRFEVKGIKNRSFEFAGIKTLADLKKKSCFKALGRKLNATLKGLVFTDDTIEVSSLPPKDLKHYLLMKDVKEWTKYKGEKTTTHRKQEQRFKALVKQYGKRDIYNYTKNLIKGKTEELTSN